MKVRKKMRARNEKLHPSVALLLSVFVMYFVSAAMLVTLALLLLKMELSESAIKIGIVFTYAVSGLIGGLLIGKMRKEKQYIWGFISGVVYFVVLFFFSYIMGGENSLDETHIITTLILCAASGLIGGMLS